MNNRIKKLDKQAVDYALSVCDANGCYQGAEYLSVVKEKFAELIVKECVQICKTVNSVKVVNAPDDYQEGREMGSLLCMEEIKKHFGVE